MKRYGKGRFNGPIFKLQPKNFDFNDEKATGEEDFLKNKMKEIGVPGSGPIRRQFYEKNLFAKQKKPTVENEYLKHSLLTNPYYVINQNEEIVHEEKDKKDLIDELKGMNQTFETDDNNNNQETTSFRGKREPAHKSLSANLDFFEKFDLQSTKSLAKYDCWDEDLSPEEWVEKCNENPEVTHAKCPFYEVDKYIWLPVKVLEYDKGKKKFLVKMIDKGIQKHVDRLSLLFDLEDKMKFKDRVLLCKHYQKRAEDEIRFQNYAESIGDERVSILSPEWERAIQNKVLDKKRMREEEYNWGLVQFKKAIRTAEAEYLREMKKCIVLREMMDEKNHEKFKNKRIKLRRNKKVIPYLGIIGKILPQERYYGFESYFAFMRER